MFSILKLNLGLDPNPAPSYYNASSGMEVYPNYTDPYKNQHIPATATSGAYSRDQLVGGEQVQHFCSFLSYSRILFILSRFSIRVTSSLLKRNLFI